MSDFPRPLPQSKERRFSQTANTPRPMAEGELRDYREAPEDEPASPSLVPRPLRLDARCRAVLVSALGVCAVLFAGSWLVTAWVVLRARTLSASGFDPFGVSILQHIYFPTAYVFEVVVVAVAGAVSVAVCRRPSKSRAKLLNAASIVLVTAALLFFVLLVIANVDAPRVKKDISERKEAFSGKFNSFYCDLRATQVCVESDESDKLSEMLGSSANVWSYCRPLLVDHRGALTDAQTNFLMSCNATSATDKWCGKLLSSRLSANESSSLSASTPFTLNPGKFRAYQNEWAARVHLDSFYLGVVVVCVSLLSLLLRPLKNEGSDGFQAVGLKTPADDSSQVRMAEVRLDMARSA